MRKLASLHRFALPNLIWFVLSAEVFSAEPDTLRLDHQVVPAFESIRLHLDPEKKEYQGEVEISLDVRTPTRSFRLHAQDLDIKDVRLTKASHVMPTRWSTGPDGLMRIATEQPLTSGPCTLTIHFENDFQDKGLGLFKAEEEGKSYLVTQFEMAYARQAFPCWDEPGFKNPFQVTLTLPANLSAFSNTAIEKTIQSGQQKTVVFEKTPPLPVYAVAFAIGPFETVPIPGLSVPGSVVVPYGKSPLATEAVNVTPPILKDLEKRFGPYPFRKLDLMAAPGMLMGAMENPGLIIFNSYGLLTDPKNMTIDRKILCARIISHELAHMWFGDLVTMEWWNDTWLNESFATWIQSNVMDEIFPRLNSFLWDIQGVQYAMGTDALPSTKPIRRNIKASDDPLQIFDELSYRKGGTVLGMVESWAGKENFHKGIIDYLEKHRWENAESKDLWSSLSNANGTGGNVAGMTGSFIDQPGIPLIRAEILSPAKLRLSQSRFLNCGFESAPQRWQIPVVFDYAVGTKRFRGKHVLTEGTEALDLDCSVRPEWLYLNVDARGYYRWLMPDSIFLTLADRSQEIMTVRERIAFIGNASALLDGGALHGDAFFKILRSFASDTVPEVLQAVLDGLRKMNDGLIGMDDKASYAHYVRSVLQPVLSRIGFEKRRDEGVTVAMLRSGVISELAELGRDERCILFCDSLTTVYLQNHAAVDAALADPILYVSAVYGDQDLFDRFIKGFESAQTPVDKLRFLWDMGAFRDRDLLKRALQYALTGPIGPMEFLSIPFAAAKFPENRSYLLDWTIQNIDVIISKGSPELMDFLVPDLVNACSDTLLLKARNFFLDPSRKRQTLEINLNKAEERMITLMRIREKEGPYITAYLKQY